MTYAWYGQGTRFLDISNPANPIQVAYYRPDNGNVWASYLHKGYIYTADAGSRRRRPALHAWGQGRGREPQGGRRTDDVVLAAEVPPWAEQVVPAGPDRRVHLHAARLEPIRGRGREPPPVR